MRFSFGFERLVVRGASFLPGMSMERERLCLMNRKVVKRRIEAKWRL